MRKFFTMAGLAAMLTFGVASPVMAQQDTPVAQADDDADDDDNGEVGLFGLVGLLGLAGLAGLLRRGRDRDVVDGGDYRRGSSRRSPA
jgi:MYXO-CTERM domain-containing protein